MPRSYFIVALSIVIVLITGFSRVANPPQAEISNGIITAKLYLPDHENGYYRATRFDWSGVISSLAYKGHQYFGQWFDKYDPMINDVIMYTVEDFKLKGYEETEVGKSVKAMVKKAEYDILQEKLVPILSDHDRMERSVLSISMGR